MRAIHSYFRYIYKPYYEDFKTVKTSCGITIYGNKLELTFYPQRVTCKNCKRVYTPK